MPDDAFAAVTCPSCGEQVPEGRYCVRCGAMLAGEGPGRARRGFSAAPHESVRRPSIVSSIFPQLPRASMLTFRVALLLGVAVVVVLAVLRYFPMALVAAAVLVPLLTVLYLIDVDVYEDEPIPVMAFTMLWGLAAGIGFGAFTRSVAPANAAVAQSAGSVSLSRGVLLPLLSVALMLAGPLLLLPRRKFNDTLDGATFGAAAAVTFAGAAAITQALDVFSAGLRPGGAVEPWVIRLLELAVAQPVLAAGVIGATGGAFWLRFRAPARDRHVLGALGNPVLAVMLAAAALIAAASAQLHLSDVPALVIILALDVLALLWLRQVVHVGLLEEASEIEIGPEIVCANCGQPTPRHTFCMNCGVALQAMPRRREPGTPTVGSESPTGEPA